MQPRPRKPTAPSRLRVRKPLGAPRDLITSESSHRVAEDVGADDVKMVRRLILVLLLLAGILIYMVAVRTVSFILLKELHDYIPYEAALSTDSVIRSTVFIEALRPLQLAGGQVLKLAPDRPCRIAAQSEVQIESRARGTTLVQAAAELAQSARAMGLCAWSVRLETTSELLGTVGTLYVFPLDNVKTASELPGALKELELSTGIHVADVSSIVEKVEFLRLLDFECPKEQAVASAILNHTPERSEHKAQGKQQRLDLIARRTTPFLIAYVAQAPQPSWFARMPANTMLAFSSCASAIPQLVDPLRGFTYYRDAHGRIFFADAISPTAVRASLLSLFGAIDPEELRERVRQSTRRVLGATLSITQDISIHVGELLPFGFVIVLSVAIALSAAMRRVAILPRGRELLRFHLLGQSQLAARKLSALDGRWLIVLERTAKGTLVVGGILAGPLSVWLSFPAANYTDSSLLFSLEFVYIPVVGTVQLLQNGHYAIGLSAVAVAIVAFMLAGHQLLVLFGRSGAINPEQE